MARVLRAALRGLSAAAALLVMCVPVEATACTTTESVTEQIRQESPDVEIRLVGGPLASRLRMGISGLVGQRIPPGDQYLLAHMPGASTSYVVRFENGCATHHGRFSYELVRAWLEGSPA